MNNSEGNENDGGDSKEENVSKINSLPVRGLNNEAEKENENKSKKDAHNPPNGN